jgi:hypothetical protein
MNHLDDLAERKRQLLARSDDERLNIARVYYQWYARSEVARRSFAIFRNPLVLAGLGIFALKMPWRKAYRLSGWGFKAWRLLRLVQRIWL